MTFYPILRTIWNRERKDDRLLSLELDFYEKARAYSSHLKTQSEAESDALLAQLFYSRWSRVNYLINDLLEMRTQKHIRDIRVSIPKPDPLPIEENEFRNRLESSIKSFKNTSLGIGDTSQQQDFETDGDTYQMIRFIANEPEVTIGSDLRQYGPFESGDIAYVPIENAAIYVKKLLAERFEV